MAGVFQPNVFQNNVFQVDVPVGPSLSQATGGFGPRHRRNWEDDEPEPTRFADDEAVLLLLIAHD